MKLKKAMQRYILKSVVGDNSYFIGGSLMDVSFIGCSSNAENRTNIF
jgi:hypothetical protein